MNDDPNVESDIDFEPEDELGETGAVQAKLKKVRAELKEAQGKRDEYLDGWQRAKADAVNARREAMLSSDRAKERAVDSLIEELIPVLDSFDQAAGSESWNDIDENWRSGMDMVRNQLLGVFSQQGIERYGKIGEQFDHAIHEAVQEIDDVAGDPGEIVKILRYGYRRGARILRPAQVIVKK